MPPDYLLYKIRFYAFFKKKIEYFRNEIYFFGRSHINLFIRQKSDHFALAFSKQVR